MREKPNEIVARQIVAEALGVPVRRFEEERAGAAQVDAEIVWTDQRAGLEIVADADQAQLGLMAALDEQGAVLDVHGLQQRWVVQVDRQRGKVKRIHQDLPAALLALQASGTAENRWRGRAMPGPLARLGVIYLARYDGEPEGRATLYGEGYYGFGGSPDAIASWVGGVLEKHGDVPSKLRAHPTAQKHAFIWMTESTPFSIVGPLAEGGRLPGLAPSLPDGVTHVWAASSWQSTYGCLAWFPDRGWWRTPWTWEGLTFAELAARPDPGLHP